ncbi:hypothetical protein CCACVL1_14996 [Corchorus capsularis]|uniref:Uncharacterized protein n=1 Tax=Corchorus capsularis TaxID=210143 RepID=A0A1R3I4M6_COCAP|nr:hypothetical protein CCACVL1_14996 [Corchorus capsularis]
MGNEKKKGKEHISAKQRPYPLGKEEGDQGEVGGATAKREKETWLVLKAGGSDRY